MGRAGRRASAIAALLLLLTATGVGVVTAGNRSSDERALHKTRAAASQGIESKVNALVGQMIDQASTGKMPAKAFPELGLNMVHVDDDEISDELPILDVV